MKLDQKGFGLVEVFAGVFLVALISFAGFYALEANKSDQPASSAQPASVSKESQIAARDAVRKRHAARFATNLFTDVLINKRLVAMSQEGFESIAARGSQEPVADPLTNKAYVFHGNQAVMAVGEVTFRLNATCDDKISGSQNAGLIIDSSSHSVAVAIKLESGNYACETNL